MSSPMMNRMLGFLSAAWAVPPAPISAVEAVKTVRPYLMRLLRFMFFLLVSFSLFGFCCFCHLRVRRCSIGDGQILVERRVARESWNPCHLPLARLLPLKTLVLHESSFAREVAGRSGGQSGTDQPACFTIEPTA